MSVRHIKYVNNRRNLKTFLISDFKVLKTVSTGETEQPHPGNTLYENFNRLARFGYLDAHEYSNWDYSIERTRVKYTYTITPKGKKLLQEYFDGRLSPKIKIIRKGILS